MIKLYNSIREFWTHHSLLQKLNENYKWSFLKYFLNLIWGGIYFKEVGTDRSIVFSIIIFKKEKNILIIKYIMQHFNEIDKAKVIQWYNTKFEEYKILNYKHIIFKINKNSEYKKKISKFFINNLEFEGGTHDNPTHDYLIQLVEGEHNDIILKREL